MLPIRASLVVPIWCRASPLRQPASASARPFLTGSLPLPGLETLGQAEGIRRRIADSPRASPLRHPPLRHPLSECATQTPDDRLSSSHHADFTRNGLSVSTVAIWNIEERQWDVSWEVMRPGFANMQQNADVWPNEHPKKTKVF
jgi:hypothetical protein